MKQCPVCNNEFKRDKLSQKYCSEECRLSRNREYDRQRKRKERAEERAIRDKENKRKQQAKNEARKQAEKKLHADRKQELMARVNNDDPLARMQVAKPFSVEYWEAYQQYEIDFAESRNAESTRTVNDISVYEDQFAKKVIITTKELGHVVTSMN